MWGSDKLTALANGVVSMAGDFKRISVVGFTSAQVVIYLLLFCTLFTLFTASDYLLHIYTVGFVVWGCH